MADVVIGLTLIIIIVLIFGVFFYGAYLGDVKDCRNFGVDSGLATVYEKGACWVTIQPGLEVRSYDFEKYFRFVEE